MVRVGMLMRNYSSLGKGMLVPSMLLLMLMRRVLIVRLRVVLRLGGILL
jgi:hypothetical protein